MEFKPVNKKYKQSSLQQHLHEDHNDCKHDHHEKNHKEDTLTKQQMKRLGFVVIFTAIYMVVEYVGGYLTNSLALMSDATHMFTDVTALALTFSSFYIASIPASDKNTYGYKRFEVLVGFVNSLVLLAIAAFIAWHAIERYLNPQEVKANGMLAISIAGLVVNLISAYLLSGTGMHSHAHDHGHDHGHNHKHEHSHSHKSTTSQAANEDHHQKAKKSTGANFAMDSAFLHVMADAVSSVGAIIASLCIMYFSWYWADPVVSALVVVMVAYSAIRLLKKSSHIILQGVPEQYDLAQIRKDILAIPDVKDLHDLHLWGLGAGKMILTAHIITSIEKFEVVLHEVKDMLLSKYDIHHSTIQMEFNDDCKEDCGIDH